VALDLSFAQAKLEDLMEDSCTITFDVEGANDGDIDPTTFERIHQPGAVEELYSGRCSFRMTSATEQSDGGSMAVLVSGVVKVPLDCPLIPNGSVVEITGSERDAEQIGRLLRVTGPLAGTFRLSRQMLVEAVEGTVVERV
jgi:hypothetical protein